VNCGHKDTSAVQSALEQAGTGLINAGGDILAASVEGGVWGIIIGGSVALASIGFGELLSLAFANCDGLVAADQFAVTGSTLKNWVSSSGVYSPGDIFYPGSDSADGCGDNSKYYVHWTVTQV